MISVSDPIAVTSDTPAATTSPIVENILMPTDLSHASPPHPPQAPNSRCRDVYSGSKFFWRTQQNIDIDIFLHISEKCIEVIAFDPHQHTQCRIYIDESTLIDHNIGSVAIANAVQAKKDAMDENEAVKGAISDDILWEEERRLLECSHILRKLQMKDSLLIYDYNSTYNEPAAISPLLDHPPKGLVPVFLHRRKLSTPEEFNNSVSSFQALNASLENQMVETAKLVEIVSEDIGNREKWGSLQEEVSSSLNLVIGSYHKLGHLKGTSKSNIVANSASSNNMKKVHSK